MQAALKILFGEFAKLVIRTPPIRIDHGSCQSRDRPSNAPCLFGARPALLLFKPERQLQLHVNLFPRCDTEINRSEIVVSFV
jgi:hypothetical protein